MEELAEKLNVPLESVDEQTRLLLENLTRQLGLVARQSGPLENSSIPPELRPQRSNVARSTVPPELRETQNASSTSVAAELREMQDVVSVSAPPEVRETQNVSASAAGKHRSQQRPIPLDHTADVVSMPKVDRYHISDNMNKPKVDRYGMTDPPIVSDRNSNSSNDYSTSYPPPELDEEISTSVSSLAPVTIDYSHGRRTDDAVTSESILASLQTDLISSSSRSNGEQSMQSSTAVPLKEKIQGSAHKADMGNRHSNTNRTGNGLIPRQLRNRPNAFERQPVANRSSSHQQLRPNMGHHQNRPSHPPPGQSRKW